MNEEELEALKLLIELDKARKSPVEKVSDTVVDIVEAPFKIAGRLFDDIFGF